MSLKKEKDAKENYEKAIEINPKDDQAYFKIAFIFYNMDQKEDAIMYFAEAFTINNKNYYATKYVKEKPDFDMSKDMNLYRKLSLSEIDFIHINYI